MEEYKNLLDSFVQKSRTILGDNLVGIYLHGSAAMGCFHSQKSDIDLLVVVKKEILKEQKRRYMDMVVRLHKQAPEKGIEFSIIRERACNPFVYPTPFELHFSVAHLNWYQTNPEDYMEKMRGTDKDLAAHCTIIYHRGKTLYGKEIREVFGEVGKENYFDSIWQDIKNAKEEIEENTMYLVLNLCRVLAFKKDNLILSKKEGGEWGLEHAPKQYIPLILEAIKEYETGISMSFDKLFAKEYAEYMLKQISD